MAHDQTRIKEKQENRVACGDFVVEQNCKYAAKQAVTVNT